MTTKIFEETKATPMMTQWHACKEKARDSILLFRMGDFYEAFYDDAALIAKELDLTLTKRQDIPMSGVPFHTCDAYIDKLVSKGYRVAVAEQIEDAKQAKGLVKRDLVRVVTPGTVVNSSLLSDKANNYFASITKIGSIYGLSFLDLTTSDFRTIECENQQELLNEIYRQHPSEFLISNKFKEKSHDLFKEIRHSYDFILNTYEDWHFEHQNACQVLTSHFGISHLDGFGLKGMTSGINAAGALLSYIQNILNLPIEHIKILRPYSTAHYMSLDRTTMRNLELIESIQDGSRKNTLISVLDKTQTPMGGRLIREWIKHPLLDLDVIHQRQDAIEACLQNPQELNHIFKLIERVRDIERLIMKISTGYATPRDLVALRYSFDPIQPIKDALIPIVQLSPYLSIQEELMDSLYDMVDLIANSLVEDPPIRLSDGNLFKPGYHQELDELRNISQNSKTWLANYQTLLRDEIGIKTLKVGYNKMFGYYIEVSKGQADRVPDTFQRRQTLVNAERYITPELKEYEQKVLTAEEKISAIENELFHELRRSISVYAPQVLRTAQAIAHVDAIFSLAMAAKDYDYIRPVVDDGHLLNIEEGRHPVIEISGNSEKFVPNDTLLDNQNNRTFIITGPNMAGKSTYIRQVALITIMAQIGSFIPAKKAHIGLIDKVFTRIGASDDLTRNQSTFMVEMTETANILHNVTPRSLVILDEIGRGTSTYDGISIAWSVAEYLLLNEDKAAKTLFATHYWELTKMEELIPGAVNYHIAVHEDEDHIIFLRKIVKGGTDKSYGIHVGKLAGLPLTVISRAKEILQHLEENNSAKKVFEPSQPRQRIKKKTRVGKDKFQLTFF